MIEMISRYIDENGTGHFEFFNHSTGEITKETIEDFMTE